MWKFEKKPKGMPEREPQDFEFFRVENISEALVREIIQNSLDAKADNAEKVTVLFKFGTVSFEEFKPFIEELIPHLESAGLWENSFYQLSLFEEKAEVPYLLIEDFGTTGLDGDVDKPSDGGSNFYDFWKREGISSKKGAKAGKWGLGKNTILMASSIRSFFGLTLRADDFREILMGKSCLKPHKIGNVQFIETGYFCDKDFDPILDYEVIKRFKEVFNIDRKNNTGLSLIIPYYKSEITAETIIVSVLQHAFYPILQDKLDVIIRDKNRGYCLNKSNLYELCQTINNQDHFEYLVFAKDTLEVVPFNVNKECPEKTDIDPNSFEIPLENLRQRYLNNEVLGFRVNLMVTKKCGQKIATYFNVYIKRNENTRSQLYWFRSGIRIIDLKNNIPNFPVIGIFVADEPVISEFLNSAETPAHTDWNERSERLKENYSNYREVLSYIKNIFHHIITLINKPPEGIQDGLLNHIFSVHEIDSEEKDEIMLIKDEEIPEKANIKILKLNKIQTGFSISINDEYFSYSSDNIFPIIIKIAVAYDCIKGNPFKNYSIYDFDFSEETKIIIRINDGEIKRREKNILIVEAKTKFFKVNVSGFDINRDIIVNAKVL